MLRAHVHTEPQRDGTYSADPIRPISFRIQLPPDAGTCFKVRGVGLGSAVPCRAGDSSQLAAAADQLYVWVRGTPIMSSRVRRYGRSPWAEGVSPSGGLPMLCSVCSITGTS